MAISGTEDISLVRKEVKESQAGSIQTTKTLIFKHEAGAGDLVIDTTLLTPPAEALANGFIQDNPSSVNLLVNKKNLKIHSSRGVWLQMHEDFKVTGANTIQLIGNIASLGGALEGEVFTIYAAPIQSNAVLTTDHKKQYQEYLLPEGQTILNLGREYEVNRNPLAQIGSIRIFRNGVGPMLRNVGNAAASPLADGNYHEIDVGNGLGTTIEFNVAPSGQDDVIVVEFGLEYAGDFSLVGDMQSMWGSILKLAEDVKDLGPYDITRYINANPSEIERRGFGDTVISNLARIARLESIPTTIRAGSGALYTPTVSGRYYQGATTMLMVPEGRWIIYGHLFFTEIGGSAGYSRAYSIWASAPPVGEQISAPAGASNLVSGNIYYSLNVPAGTPEIIGPVITLEMYNAVPTPIYLVPLGNFTTPANARISTGIFAQRIGL